MSTHIRAKRGEIAESILLPGDPLRAKHIAENYLTDVIQYNDVRNMLGYTGYYQGERISVQGTGMGVPSISIYLNELIHDYDVQTMIRVGSCGALQENIQVRDLIIAQGATTDSQMNRMVFGHIDFSPLATFDLMKTAHDLAIKQKLQVTVGNVFTSDSFYRDDAKKLHDLLNQYNVLAIEMETTALYTLAQKYQRKALSILTVSDHILTGEETSADERQTTFNEMTELALETIIQS